MKLHPSLLLPLFIVPFILLSCDKIEEDPEGEVEIYLLESYELVGGEFSSAINESSVIAESEPFIPYGGMRYYHSSDHAFKLTNDFADTFKNRHFPVQPSAFGVYANDELIYTGYFIPAISSVSCAWITIDPLIADSDKRLDIKLGYPGPIEGVEIPDHRNDPRILAIFKRDGKLK